MDEKKKDFNKMLHNAKDMPKMKILNDAKVIAKYGGSKMFFAPPISYDELMRQVPQNKITTIPVIRSYLAKINHADFTEPITAGAFISIAAWASFQRTDDKIPYWRTLKAHGELHPKYPGGIQQQKILLEQEGHEIIVKGRKNIRYYVKDYENRLFTFE